MSPEDDKIACSTMRDDEAHGRLATPPQQARQNIQQAAPTTPARSTPISLDPCRMHRVPFVDRYSKRWVSCIWPCLHSYITGHA